MANKHVHWWDHEATGNDSDNASFLPPSPDRPSTLAPITDDDDSLVDSPFPPTPLTILPSLAPRPETYQSLRRARGAPIPVQIPVRSFTNPRIRSPDRPSWCGEHSPGYDAFSMSSLGQSMPLPNPVGPSPRKISAELTRQSRQDSVRSPSLHPLLTYVPSARTPALVWNVGDMPSYSTVLTPTADGNGKLVPVLPNVLDEPATNPPVKEMHIHCISYSLWEPLIVRPDSHPSPRSTDSRQTERARRATEYIALKHVIFEVFQYLHTRMSKQEYDALKELPAPDLQRSVSKSFYKRCEAEEHNVLTRQRTPTERRSSGLASPSSELPGVSLGARSARTGGLRRLDCLLGQTRFLGLSEVPGASGDWFINLAAPAS